MRAPQPSVDGSIAVDAVFSSRGSVGHPLVRIRGVSIPETRAIRANVTLTVNWKGLVRAAMIGAIAFWILSGAVTAVIDATAARVGVRALGLDWTTPIAIGVGLAVGALIHVYRAGRAIADGDVERWMCTELLAETVDRIDSTCTPE